MICDIRHLSSIFINPNFGSTSRYYTGKLSLFSIYTFASLQRWIKRTDVHHTWRWKTKNEQILYFCNLCFCPRHHKIVHIFFVSVKSNFAIYPANPLKYIIESNWCLELIGPCLFSCFIIGFPYHHLFPRIIGHNLDNLLQGLNKARLLSEFLRTVHPSWP